jgi:hypothetical protein
MWRVERRLLEVVPIQFQAVVALEPSRRAKPKAGKAKEMANNYRILKMGRLLLSNIFQNADTVGGLWPRIRPDFRRAFDVSGIS